jgi:acyl-CoA synthetase (AMP-forming)/AMP-acid ligase II
MLPGLTHALRRAARWRGKDAALIDSEGTVTYGEYASRAARLAGVLQSLGVRRGERVANLALNSHRYPEFFYGALWAGAIAVPLNHRLAVPELAAQLADCEPVVLLVDAEFLATGRTLAAGCPSIRHIIFAAPGEAPAGLIPYEGAIAAGAAADDAGSGETDTACIFYTGGTTGRSKGVMLSHNNLWSNAGNAMAPIDADERLTHLHHGPLFHVSAGARLFVATALAAKQVIIPKFDADDVLATIERERVAMTTFVPTMMRTLVNLPTFDRYDISSLRYINYGASPTDETLLRAAMKRFSHVKFLQGYGMTETSPIIAQLLPQHHHTEGPHVARLRSAGRATLWVELRIGDENDNEVPAGQVGEIIVRGPQVMKGYWNQPEQTAQALRNGWMHTGDLGYMDEDGFIFLVDRKSDMIISGGENVHTVEVENAIQSHPAVLECAVIGVPDDTWGEIVHAVVVLHDGHTLTIDALKAHCRPLIAGYKIPRSLELRTERLPLSGANKILKSALRAEKRKG